MTRGMMSIIKAGNGDKGMTHFVERTDFLTPSITLEVDERYLVNAGSLTSCSYREFRTRC